MESLHSTKISDLPNEMLEQIFNFLENPNDFLAVIGTCHRWHDIMAYRKTERLFGKVLPILLQDDLLPLRSMLTLRQIRTNWKEEVKIQLQQSPSRSRLISKYNLEEAEQVNRLIAHARNLPQGGNPFLGNHLTITMDDPGAYDQILQLIQQHGTPLMSVVMHFISNNFPHIELASILGGIPNVEILSILGFIENWDVGDGVDTSVPPLPFLNNLGVVMLGADLENQPNDDRYQRLLSVLLTAYGEQLGTLRCSKELLRIGGISDLLLNLRRLDIFLPHRSTDTFTQNDFHVLSQVGWRLHTFTFWGCYIPLTVEFMAALNNFSTTLENLDIFIEVDEHFDPDLLASFPLLKILTLAINSELQSIPLGMKDKLMKLAGVAPNLEELSIILRNKAFCDVVWDFTTMSFVFKKLIVFKLFRPL
ncbi:unnamed protein product [Orchesella dallaii]|uniref:F-box domain-containing protein n=1 Tax=Orchesella dallaii TaxID=48710 RepID=A0ABP1R2B4_9HEXA